VSMMTYSASWWSWDSGDNSWWFGPGWRLIAFLVSSSSPLVVEFRIFWLKRFQHILATWRRMTTLFECFFALLSTLL
jgi:hypothetical protein